MSMFLRRRREPSRVVAILGMHRSGTSWLTGTLEDLGLPLGRVRTRSKHNPKGNRESPELNAIHDRVLLANGGTWRDPRWPNEWPQKQRDELQRYIRGMDGHEVWGAKDPRMLLLLEEWHRQVPGLIRVGVYRHPIKVFRSLHARRSDFTQEEAIRLWRTYNERLLAEHARSPFPVIRFDVDGGQLWAGLATLRDHIGVRTDKPLEGFFDADLLHQVDEVDQVPVEVADEWAALERIAINA